MQCESGLVLKILSFVKLPLPLNLQQMSEGGLWYFLQSECIVILPCIMIFKCFSSTWITGKYKCSLVCLHIICVEIGVGWKQATFFSVCSHWSQQELSPSIWNLIQTHFRLYVDSYVLYDHKIAWCICTWFQMNWLGYDRLDVVVTHLYGLKRVISVLYNRPLIDIKDILYI